MKSKEIKNLVTAGMCLAISVAMPSVFHIFGPQAGKMFLPLFWGVVIAALILPLKYSVTVAFAAPIISYFVSAMPAVPMLYFMIAELISYSFFVWLLHKKCNEFITVLLGLILSRTVYIAVVSITAVFVNLPAGFTGISVLLSGVLLSIPGIAAQVIIVPIIYKIYSRVGKNEF